MLLALVNMVGGLYFIGTWEGRWTLICLLGSFLVMTYIFSRHGFVRLLGLGHLIFWPPLLAYFLWVFQLGAPIGLFRIWLLAVFLLNGLSLLIDFLDVIRYLRGDRAAA